MSGLQKQSQYGVGDCEVRRQTLKEELTSQLKNAHAEVDRLTELLNLLQKNPEIDRIMELLKQRY